MAWYAASIIMYVQFKAARQATYPVWENVILIEADSDDVAGEKARRRALEDEGDASGTFRWEGKPAAWKFAGIRKLLKCDNHQDRPGDSTEITYSQMVVSTLAEVDLLARGEPVTVYYEE